MLSSILNFKPKDYAQFAPLVLEYYEKGDHNACQIINYEISIIEKSIRSAGFQPEKPFCLLGGLGNFYKKHISPEFSKFVVEPLGDAASGALSIAKGLICKNKFFKIIAPITVDFSTAILLAKFNWRRWHLTVPGQWIKRQSCC